MKHFLRIAAGVDTMPLMHALARKPELWDAHKARTTFDGTPFSDVSDIWLRFNDDRARSTQDTMHDDALVWHEAAFCLPQVRPIVRDLMRAVDAYALDRLLITKLRPGGRILPHSDNQGAYTADPDRARYHVVLQGLPGSLYRTGDETVQMLTGEVWFFNAHVEHEVLNNSADDRVHLLVDLRIWP